nr:hypothetical protein [Tanacetum cinerariifolium]
SRRRGRFAAGDVARIPLNLIIRGRGSPYKGSGGGARVAFKDEFGVAKEREVSRESQQGRSGAKRKIFKSCRNNMGNESILALPKGSDSFVVMRRARVRMLA